MNDISNKIPCEPKECYSINEVSEMFGLSEWTIRLWCNRIDILKPYRNETGDLMFTLVDVNHIETISRLVKKKRMKLKSVKKHLETKSDNGETTPVSRRK
jgi:DNA-binding transcriptional MerR regulator